VEGKKIPRIALPIGGRVEEGKSGERTESRGGGEEKEID